MQLLTVAGWNMNAVKIISEVFKDVICDVTLIQNVSRQDAERERERDQAPEIP